MAGKGSSAIVDPDKPWKRRQRLIKSSFLYRVIEKIIHGLRKNACPGRYIRRP